MQVATNDPTVDPSTSTDSTASKNESWKIVEVLECRGASPLTEPDEVGGIYKVPETITSNFLH